VVPDRRIPDQPATVYFVNASASSTTKLFSYVVMGRPAELALSPDGRTVLYLLTEQLPPTISAIDITTIRQIMRLVLSLSALSVLSLAIGPAPARGPHYEHVFTLKPKEGVFAYARISPDGKRLAYASQISARPSAQRNWSVTAVDLETKKTLFTENGIDAYWSNDGTRVIYSGMNGVTIRNVVTNASNAYAEASSLGDYFSWSVRDGRI
jgi:Tol biopolymer transport system component